MPSTASNRRVYDLWRIRQFPLTRFPAERVWRRGDGRLYYSRDPRRETPETVAENGNSIFWAPAKNGWYRRLIRSLKDYGQANPVCIHAHLPRGPVCIRGSSRCWALAEIGDLAVDAVVSLPRGLKPCDIGLQGLPVEATEADLKAQFEDCNTVHFDDKEWDARPPQIEIYEQKARAAQKRR